MSVFKEVEIEDFIWDNIAKNPMFLKKRGLKLDAGIFYRQLQLPNCGIPDLVSFYSFHEQNMTYLKISVYELKRGNVDGNALAQLLKYLSFFSSNADRIADRFDMPVEFRIMGTLIGHSFDKSVLSLHSVVEADIDFIIYQIDLENGVVFKSVTDDYGLENLDNPDYSLESDFKWIGRVNEMMKRRDKELSEAGLISLNAKP